MTDSVISAGVNRQYLDGAKRTAIQVQPTTLDGHARGFEAHLTETYYMMYRLGFTHTAAAILEMLDSHAADQYRFKAKASKGAG